MSNRKEEFLNAVDTHTTEDPHSGPFASISCISGHRFSDFSFNTMELGVMRTAARPGHEIGEQKFLVCERKKVA